MTNNTHDHLKTHMTENFNITLQISNLKICVDYSILVSGPKHVTLLAKIKHNSYKLQ